MTGHPARKQPAVAHWTIRLLKISCSTSFLGGDRLGVPVSVLLGPQQSLTTYTWCKQLCLVGFIRTWLSIIIFHYFTGNF